MAGKEYALFLGCTSPVRNPNYEVSARKVCEKLEINTVDVDEFTCCGYPIRPVDRDTSMVMAAFNLCVAQEKGLDLLCLCNACTASLTKTQKILTEDDELRDEVNKHLKPLNKEFEPGVRIRHFTRFLYEDIGVDRITETVTRSLSQFKIAPHYGCHYLKPSDIYDRFDDPANPQSLHKLINATGAKAVNYYNPKQCCGAGILGIFEDLSMKMTKRKLDAIKEVNADAMVLHCPFCSILFDEYQRAIGNKYNTEYKLPVLFYPQLLGLAMGYDPIELGLKKNVVKPKAFLKVDGA